MKPVANIYPAFPRVGDVLRMKAESIPPLTDRWAVVRILSCDRRDRCTQDSYCTHCLTLQLISGREESRTTQHCWNDPNGNAYWEIETPERRDQ